MKASPINVNPILHEFHINMKSFLVIAQLDAQILFHVFIYLYFSTCFEHVMLETCREV